MYWDIVKACVSEPWCIDIEFRDGLRGRLRFDRSFFDGVFEPLKSSSLFGQVFVESGALAWPGGIDLAPDALHRLLKASNECVLSGSGAGISA